LDTWTLGRCSRDAFDLDHVRYCSGTRTLRPGVWIERFSSLDSNCEPGV